MGRIERDAEGIGKGSGKYGMRLGRDRGRIGKESRRDREKIECDREGIGEGSSATPKDASGMPSGCQRDARRAPWTSFLKNSN